MAKSSKSGKKPNIILILSDDFGYGDAGVYGGGENRGMPTPNLDRMAAEGMQFMSFYAQPSCTPGRAAVLTGRIPNRSGMTTVAFQGQGGGLPAAEWTLASVLKTGGYNTFFTGKWHLGESDYALPNAHGYDEMRYCGLYHLNAYTYADPTWFPDMDPDLREMFERVTKGALSGKAGGKVKEDFKVNGQYVNTPDKGVVGIPFYDEYVEKAALEYLDKTAKVVIAILHERQFHEGSSAEHAAPRLQGEIAFEEQVRRLDRGERCTHRPHHGQDPRPRHRRQHLCVLDDGQRRLAGRLSGRRLHAIPRHEGNMPRRRQSRSVARVGSRNQSWIEKLRHRRWSRLHGHLRLARRHQAAEKRSRGANPLSSTATTCRRSCSAPANPNARTGSTSPRTN